MNAQFFWTASCTRTRMRQFLCRVNFTSPLNSIFITWSCVCLWLLSICGNASYTSLRSMMWTSNEYTAIEIFSLIIEMHSLAAIWLDGVNSDSSAASQSRSSNDLLFNLTKVKACFNSCFPTFKSGDLRRSLNKIHRFLGLRWKSCKHYVSTEN